MGTRIVVLKDGVIHQVADPSTLYKNPVNVFVASFIGSPQMNFIDARIVEKDDVVQAEFKGGSASMPPEKESLLKEKGYVGKEVILGIRPEHISVDVKTDDDGNRALVEVTELLGSETFLFLNLESKTIIARVDPSLDIRVNTKVVVNFERDQIHIFDKETEEALF